MKLLNTFLLTFLILGSQNLSAAEKPSSELIKAAHKTLTSLVANEKEITAAHKILGKEILTALNEAKGDEDFGLGDGISKEELIKKISTTRQKWFDVLAPLNKKKKVLVTQLRDNIKRLAPSIPDPTSSKEEEKTSEDVKKVKDVVNMVKGLFN